MGIIPPLHLTNKTSRKMKASILAMFGLLALTNAAPQYGYSNNFSGSKKPLTGSYSNCKVEWKTVKKAGYEEVTEYKENTVYKTVCKNIYVEHCKDVQKTIYEYEEKCEQKQVEKCEEVPKIVKEVIHKKVPIQIEGKVAYRSCPGQADHEYTPTEVRTIDFTGY